jgi:hypothetical protein
VWGHQATLTGAAVDDALFGSSVSLEGDQALVGALGEEGAGAAYVFARDGTTWSLESRFEASDAQDGDAFGRSVSLSGGTALTGASAEDEHGIDAGAAYVFIRQPRASVTFRNAGTNPVSYQATSDPVLGDRYDAFVKLGITTGHSHALLVGYAKPLTVTLGGGQTLLVDLADPLGELLGQAPLAGPTAWYYIPVPADAALAGFEVPTQALHFGGVSPFALSNAQDLFLGY